MLKNRLLGAVLSAFAVGWSGFSVYFQIRGICSECEFSFRGYLLSRLVQGGAAALLTALLFPLVLSA